MLIGPYLYSLPLIRSAACQARPQHRSLRATNGMVLSAARTPISALTHRSWARASNPVDASWCLI